MFALHVFVRVLIARYNGWANLPTPVMFKLANLPVCLGLTWVILKLKIGKKGVFKNHRPL